jgi:hypothetical protein
MRLASFSCLLFVVVGIAAAQDTNFPVGPQYLLTGSPILAQSIATPTMSLDTPLPPLPSLPEVGPPVTDQAFIPNPELQHQADLFPIYYGYPMPSVVVLISSEPPRELPQSIVEAGVTGMTDVQSLRERGYGVPLGETASYWKSHKPRAPRVFTNADVERLHGS